MLVKGHSILGRNKGVSPGDDLHASSFHVPGVPPTWDWAPPISHWACRCKDNTSIIMQYVCAKHYPAISALRLFWKQSMVVPDSRPNSLAF